MIVHYEAIDLTMAKKRLNCKVARKQLATYSIFDYLYDFTALKILYYNVLRKKQS